MLPPYIKERGTIVLGSEDSPPGFCKVFVPKYLEGDVGDLPFAEIQAPVGSRQNEGSAGQVFKDDYVWVEMHQSEAKPATLKVIVVGSAFSAPNGLPNMPSDSFDGLQTLYKRHLIPRDDEGNIHEDFEEPKRYVKGRAIAIVEEGISYVKQSGQLIITSLKTLSHLIFLDSGKIDLFAKENLFLRAKKNLHIWANKISFKGKTVEFNLDDLVLQLKKFGVDASEITLESGGLAKILAAAIQLTSTGDFIVSSSGKYSQDAVGSALTKVSQDMLTDPLDAMGWMLDIKGVLLASFLLKTKGTFELKNILGSLKPDVLDKILDHLKAILGFIDEFLTEYISHAHPCVAPTGPAFTASKMIPVQVKIQMEMVTVDLTKASLALIME